MLMQINQLLKVNLRNRFGFNEAIYGKDPQKKRRLIMVAIAMVIVAVMLTFYMGALSYGFTILGKPDLIPSYVLAVTSLIILFFTMFKAGEMIFQMKTYEMLISLPIKPVSIVLSRFLNMYIENLLWSVLMTIPSFIVYILFAKPGVFVAFMLFISIFVLPLIPMTIATAIGALITAISSKMKHKNLVSVTLSMIFLIGFLVLTSSFSAQSENYTLEQLSDIATILSGQMSHLYPPVVLYNSAIIDKNIGAFLLFLLISVGSFALFIALVQWKFVAISSALHTTATKNNYKMQELSQSSQLSALYKKEIKRYFASSIYVMNTLVGYVLVVVFAITIFVMGVDKLNEMLQMTGIVEKTLPFITALLCTITTTTISSISMEGKQFWIVQSLPVSTKEVFDSKILVNLTIALPCLLVADIFLICGVKTSILGYIWIVLMPFLFTLFASVLGITVNAKLPMLNWEAEVTVVKQSGAVFIGMMISFVAVGICAVGMFVPSILVQNAWMGLCSVVILAITFALYQNNNKLDLKKIDSK